MLNACNSASANTQLRSVKWNFSQISISRRKSRSRAAVINFLWRHKSADNPPNCCHGGRGQRRLSPPPGLLILFRAVVVARLFVIIPVQRNGAVFLLLKTFCVSSSPFPCLKNDFKINRGRFMLAHNSLTTMRTRARVWEATANVFLVLLKLQRLADPFFGREGSQFLMWWITGNLLRHPGFYSLFRATTCQIRLSISCLMKAQVDQQRCLLLFSSCMIKNSIRRFFSVFYSLLTKVFFIF